MSTHSSIPRDPNHAGTSLANERTFLAWVRTSLTLFSFGYGILKVSFKSLCTCVFVVCCACLYLGGEGAEITLYQVCELVCFRSSHI